MISVRYWICEYRESDEGGYQEIETELDIEGTVTAGEAPSWGYYGGSPGCPDEAEITDIYEVIPVQGPPILSVFNIYKDSKYAKMYPIDTILVPCDGDLSKDDEDRVKNLLIEAAKEAAEDAKAEAYIDRYY